MFIVFDIIRDQHNAVAVVVWVELAVEVGEGGEEALERLVSPPGFEIRVRSGSKIHNRISMENSFKPCLTPTSSKTFFRSVSDRHLISETRVKEITLNASR